jgi:phenylacetate-CoA ligase
MINRLALLKMAAQLTSNSFLRYYKQLKKNRELSKQELENISLEKHEKIIEYASENIPFYKRRLAGKDIPVLGKQELKDAGMEVVRPKKGLIKKTTSGTTGPAFSFYVDKEFFALELARNLRIFDFANVELGEPWLLLVPLRNKKNWIFSYLTNRLVLDATLLSKGRVPLCCPKTKEAQFKPDEQIIQMFFNKIQRYKPRLVYSYPSTLIALATYIRKWNVKNVSVEKIILSGEILTRPARKYIEETFQGEVFDLYGTTEFPGVAQECREHRGMHIFTDSFNVEFTNKNEIIITDLENYTMPFIRYNTNDFGHTIPEKCKCGIEFPLMEITQGRISDLIVAPNGQFLRAGFFSSIIEKNQDIKMYQMVQEKQSILKVYIVTDKTFSNSRIEYLNKRFSDYVGESINVSVEIVPNINLPLKQYFQVYPVRTIL